MKLVDVGGRTGLHHHRPDQLQVPLTWMTSIEDGRKLLYCDRCARENVCSIEGELDSVYWSGLALRTLPALSRR